MDHYYLALKLINYLNYEDLYYFRQVCRNWRTAFLDQIYSLRCKQCLQTGRPCWRIIKVIPSCNTFEWEIKCSCCLAELEDKPLMINDCPPHLVIPGFSSNFDQYYPAIPLSPGEQVDFWITSDLPEIWLKLWRSGLTNR